MEMLGDQAETEVIYDWLGEAVNEMQGTMYPMDAYSYYMVASLSRYLADNSLKDEYITDYFNVVGYVDQAIANASSSNDEANAEYLAMLKEGIVQGFVNSGAGDCKTQQYYADKVEPNKDNKNSYRRLSAPGICGLQRLGLVLYRFGIPLPIRAFGKCRVGAG